MDNTNFMQLESINLYVRDMSKTVLFYKNLGVQFKESDETRTYVKVVFEGINLCFYDIQEVKKFFSLSEIRIKDNIQFNLSFRVDKLVKIDQIQQTMKKNGFLALKGPLDTDWNQRTLFYNDPDGNLVEICAHLPKDK